MQFHCAENVRVDVLLELLQVFLKGLEKSPVEGALELLHDLRSDLPLKPAFGPFELS